jgi:CPA2 family monovalent cation:H+ antiporter-2
MSLVIAKGGQDVGAITSSVLPILSVVTIITAFASPYIIRFAHNIKSTKTEYKGDDEVKTNID